MNIKEIRNEYKTKRRFAELTNNYEMLDYYDDIWRSMEDLYTYGSVTEFSREFLALANGYVNTQEYNNFHIAQTLDLHRITASRHAAREFMYYWLHF